MMLSCAAADDRLLHDVLALAAVFLLLDGISASKAGCVLLNMTIKSYHTRC